MVQDYLDQENQDKKNIYKIFTKCSAIIVF